MENEVKQRNQRNRRRERAQRMQAQRENKVKDGDSGEDESPAREKPPRPPARRKKSREPLGEEDIIDGFAIMAFRTYEDLEAAVKCASSPRTNALSTKPRLPFVSLATDPARNHPPNNVNSHGITLLQDAGTSDDSGRASERLTGSSVAPRDPDSSRDRLSDASSRCSSGKGYICDSEGDDDKASPENSRNASPRYHDTSMDDGSDAGTLFRVAGAGGGKNELVARGGSGGALALSRAPVGGSASPAPAPLPQPAPSPAPAALPPPALPPPNFRPDAPHRPNGAHIPPEPHHPAAATHIPARAGPDTPERPASNNKPQTGARAAADSPTPAPPAPPAPSPLFPSHSAFQSHAAAALPDYRHTNHETRTDEGAAPAPLDLGGARAPPPPARALPPPRPAAPLAPPASPVSLPSSPRAVSPAVHAARPYPVSSIPSSHVNSSISSSIHGLASPYSQPGPPKHSVPPLYAGRPPHLAPYGMAPHAPHVPHAPPHLNHSMMGHAAHHPHPLSNPLMAPLPSHLGPPPPLASTTSTISSYTTSLKHPVVPTLSGPLSAPAHSTINHVDALPSLPISSSAPTAVTTPTNSSRPLPPPINLDSRPQSVEAKEPRVSALEPRPGALELRPPTIESRPPTHETPRPTSIDHRPQVLDTRPSPMDIRPSPLDNRPAPMDTRPSPMDTRPTQIDTRPLPIDTRPTPMDTRPTPMDIRPPPLDTRPNIFDARPSLIDSRPVDTRPLDTRPSTLDIRPPTSTTEIPRSEHNIVSSIQSSNGYPPPAIYSSAAYPPLYAPYASSLQHSPYLPPSAASPRNTADARATLSSPLVAPKTPKGVRPHTPGSSGGAGPQPLSYSPVGRSPSRERDGFGNISSLSRSTVASGVSAVPSLAPPLSAPLAPPITCGLAAPTPTAAAAPSAGPLAPTLAPVPTVPSISSGAKPAAHWGVTRPSTERSSGFGPVPPLFGAPLPPPPNPNPFSAESLFQTNPGADLLRRELDSRFLAAATRTEMHHHQHQHTHVHQHHQLHPALHPALHPPQYKDVNKMPSLYRSGLGLGYPYSSSLMHPAAPYVPPAPITPYAPKPASDAAKPAPRPASKTGKWNAMHVRIAWEIYNHQQKEKAGSGGVVPNPADKEKRAFPTPAVTAAANPYRGAYEMSGGYLHAQHAAHAHAAVPRYDPAAAERLRQAGVGYARYLPPHGYPLYRELPALHAVPPPLPALHDPWRAVPRPPPAAAAAALQRERDERERRDRDDRERRKLRDAERARARSPLRNGAPDPPKLEAKEPPRGPHALPSYGPPPHAWDPYRAFDPLHHMRFAPLVEAAIRAEEDRAKMLSAYAHHHQQMKAGPLLHRGLGPPPPLPPLAAPLGPLPPMAAPPLDLLKKEEPR